MGFWRDQDRFKTSNALNECYANVWTKTFQKLYYTLIVITINLIKINKFYESVFIIIRTDDDTTDISLTFFLSQCLSYILSRPRLVYHWKPTPIHYVQKCFNGICLVIKKIEILNSICCQLASLTQMNLTNATTDWQPN